MAMTLVEQSLMVFVGITLMAVHFAGLNFICQSFSHCSSEGKSDLRACWSLSVALKEEAIVCEQLDMRGAYDTWKIKR